jgi:hypothetical protein
LPDGLSRTKAEAHAVNARRFAARKCEAPIAAYLDDIGKDGGVVRKAYNLRRPTFSAYPKLQLPADDSLLNRYKIISEPASVSVEVANIRTKAARLSKNKFLSMDLEWNSLGSQGPVAIIALGCMVEGDFYSWIFHMPALLKGFFLC